MATAARRIKLGSQGFEVSARGLGCMGMSYHFDRPKPESEMIKVIHHAVDSGITHLDTSNSYGPHTNEILIGKALKGGYREKVQLATKFGFKVLEDGSRAGVFGDPEFVRASCESSLKRLDVDYIDLFYVHRIDTRVPIEVTVGELRKLVEEGKIKYIRLSEASPETIRRAHAVHPITAVQLEWSLWTRDAEESVIPTCRELGIGIVAFCPLGMGFLASGPDMINNLASNDIRKSLMLIFTFLRILPRFQEENVEQNLKIFDRVNQIATRKGRTPSQLALAWVHHRGTDVCPIPGTTKIENLNNNIKGLSVQLSPEEMVELESLADAVKGERLHAPSLSLTWKYANTPPLSSWKAT